MNCEYCRRPTDDATGAHQTCTNKFHQRQNMGHCVVCGDVLDDRDTEWNKNCHSRCEGEDYTGY